MAVEDGVHQQNVNELTLLVQTILSQTSKSELER